MKFYLTLLFILFHMLVSAQNINDEYKEVFSNMSYNSTSGVEQDTSFTEIADLYTMSCLEQNQNQTTKGMIDCYRAGIHKLDTLVKIKYEEIYAKLDSTDKAAFKISHENWQRYFKAESEFLYGSFYTWANYSQYGHGREHSITQKQWQFQIIRQRYIALCNYNAQLYKED